jgi:hypothetical protein
VFPLAVLAEYAAHPDADALKQNFLVEHEIGRRYQVDPDHLAPPKTSPNRHQSTFDIILHRAGSPGATRVHGYAVRDRSRQSTPPFGASQWVCPAI